MIFTISELCSVIKDLLELSFTNIEVRGEVSGLSIARSGHTYFNLRDDSNSISVVCWRGTKAIVEEGVEVICSGHLTSYQSKWQLVLKQIQKVGAGISIEILQERKERLQQEGLFDNKRPLPELPLSIAVITSPTGSVLHDIIHRIEERFPLPILVFSATMQGEKSTREIVAALELINSLSHLPSVIIIARGGGSIEELWSFNDEELVRAVAASGVPVISAIGHETDHTLIDYAADLRAPTPTAAAEMATPLRSYVTLSLTELQRAISNRIQNFLGDATSFLEKVSIILASFSKENEMHKLHLLDLKRAINYLTHNAVAKKVGELELLASKINHLLAQALERSAAYIFNQEGKPILAISEIKIEDTIRIKFLGQVIEAKILKFL